MTDHQHLDLDELADVVAGQRSETDLAGCAACLAALASLRAADEIVLARLGDLANLEPPAPVMPSAVAARLEAALRDQHGPAGSLAPPAHPDLPAHPERRWWRPLTAAAAAVALAGGLTATLLQTTGSQPGSGSSTGTAASTGRASSGRAGAQPEPYRGRSGLDYGPDRVLLTSALPSLLTGRATAGAAATRSGPASGPLSGSATPPDPARGPEVDPLAPLEAPARLAGCLSALLPPEDLELRPLALDYARFQGQPALVVILPTPLARQVEVYVVGAACAADDEALLFYTRLELPR